jgi:HEAT repeat protein
LGFLAFSGGILAANHNKVLRLVPPAPDPGRLLAQGLVDLYKAVKGASFYPDGHPYRVAPLERACEALARVTEKRELTLSVTREGFVPALEAAEEHVMILQLAQECRLRRIASITMENLLLKDLKGFAELLGSDPQSSVSRGGFGRQLWARGVRSVRVQDREYTPVSSRLSGGGSEVAPRTGPEGAPPAGKHGIGELLGLMAREPSDLRYQQMGRELVQSFTEQREDFAVLPVLEELLRQHRDQQKSLPQQEYALFILDRLTEGSAERLLDSLESRDCPDKDAIVRVLAALGEKGVYRVIQRLCLAQGVFERKALARALVRVGAPATAPVIAMLKDDRWYVVRNMAAILGELRAPEAVAALKKPLYHEDERVRKEAVRALMKIGGEAAEAALIALVEDTDQVVAKHAILSLGLMGSRQAVLPLLRLLEQRDLLMKTLPAKKEAALALGRIGDRRAAPLLLKIVESRGWPVLGRQLELRAESATALGMLGDEAALPLLSSLSQGSGLLAEACREAVDAIERISGGVP